MRGTSSDPCTERPPRLVLVLVLDNQHSGVIEVRRRLYQKVCMSQVSKEASYILYL